jgi:hypothetical protein
MSQQDSSVLLDLSSSVSKVILLMVTCTSQILQDPRSNFHCQIAVVHEEF